MCPRCGNAEGGKVFVVGREERCEKCYKIREPQKLEKLRKKTGYYNFEDLTIPSDDEE
jgi:hypothetical protein